MEYFLLNEISSIKGGKRIPKGESLSLTINSHPYIRVVDMNRNSITELNNSFQYVPDLVYSKISRYIVNQDDIIISVVGTVGAVSMIGSSLNGANLTENCVKITVNKKVYLPEYVFSVLASGFGQKQIQNGIVGSVQPKLPLYNIEKIRIPKVSISEQQIFVATIKPFLQQLIENKKLLTNLEEYSQLLFHKWFVDFNFPDKNGNPYKDSGGEMVEVDGMMIPRGWNSIPLSKSANFINGLAMQKYPPKDNDDLLPVIKIKEINNNGFTKDSEYMTKSINSDLLIENGDILFPWSGSLSVNIWAGGRGGLNQHIFKVQPTVYEKWFVLHWIKRHMHYFETIAYGKKVTMGHINLKHLSMVNVLIPNKEILIIMNQVMVPIYSKIVALMEENNILVETRDLLIKKLIK